MYIYKCAIQYINRYMVDTWCGIKQMHGRLSPMRSQQGYLAGLTRGTRYHHAIAFTHKSATLAEQELCKLR